MIIEKFTKNKNGMYKLDFEGGKKMLLHEDLILKYELLLKRNISSDVEEKILIENNNYLAYNKAIKFIGVKMRSIKETREYLAKLNIDSNIIELVIEKLVSQGYLDDEKYCISFVNDKIALSNNGPSKIRMLLKQSEIDDSLIDKALFRFDLDVQKEKISKIISKNIKGNCKGINLFKQKILYNLINLGYDRALINEELSKIELDDRDLYKKEYQKIYDKLSKKYSGKELDYKVRQKLFQKGFSNFNDIE